MPKEVIKHNTRQSLVIDEEKLSELESWLCREIDDAYASRRALESQWREDMRLYEAIPPLEVNDFPIENAPNLEIPLAAIASDTIAAQATDTIFSVSPLVTCRAVPKRPNDKETNKKTKAIQRFVNWIATNESNVRAAANEMILDDVQLGTGVFYIPWTERRKKTKTAKIITRKPVIRCMPPEDVLLAGGSYGDTEELLWISFRFWLTKNQVIERGLVNKWDIDGFQTAGAKDWVRTRREALGKHLEGVERKAQLYDIYDIYCFFDIDGDGIDEDLYVVYNHTGRKVGKVTYNPFDRRPSEYAVYQRRPHLWYGLGVPRMLAAFQREMSDLHNYQILNALLANCRMWATKEGVVPENMRIWPGKQVPVPDPQSDIKELKLSDVYASLPMVQMLVMQLAERRTGVNEMSMPRQSAVMGSRTPGITALTLTRQANRRFAPAFDSIRQAIGNALKQCLYRYQEQLLAGRDYAFEHIVSVLGFEDGQLVAEALRDESFDENITIELTAASATGSKEADRQDAIILAQLLATYYQRTLELVSIAASPETPPPVVEVAKQIIDSAKEVIDRTIRTFDSVRDPMMFIVDIEEALNQQQPAGGQDALAGMMQMLQGPSTQMLQAPETPYA